MKLINVYTILFAICIGYASSGFADSGDDLIMAASQGNVSKVKALIKRGVNVNAAAPATSQVPQGITPLMFSSAENHLEITKILLDAGADPNQSDKGGGTALIYAVWKGHLHIVKLLIEHGANVHAETTDGRTPLSVAKNGGKSTMVELLETAGAKR